ncbi:2793_t:CDS:1 [Scutellospora calospora]|uniref:2793_t:CDS:1 n=1 Tax=Scutellospora calospora TaxID=85575 RepID=A0ACA9L6S3_9GLOM|nr:2793_t:CDS:1 [Scutellospora calospora]
MVTKYKDIQIATFSYNSENKCIVISDIFENKIGLYLKRNGLKPKIIKNYTFTDRRFLMRKDKSLWSGRIILLNNGSIEGLEVINTGRYTIFGDDGTDIWCNYFGCPLLVQCKFQSVCDICKLKRKKCSHGYWKKEIIKDIKKLDDKLSEYKVDVFGIFVISEDIMICEEIKNMKFKNIMKVVNFYDGSKKNQNIDESFDGLKNQIDMLGKKLLQKSQMMDWCINLVEDK